MFTTGTKFLIGSTVLATIAAIAYGLTQQDELGTIGLASAAISLAFLAGVNLVTRDANVWADEISSVETTAASVRAPRNSVWPLGFAFGAAVVTVGLVTQQVFFVVGVVILLATGAEWTAEAWANRASLDPAHNARVRSTVANPLEFPLGAAIGIGIIVYTFSRIMLWLSKTNTVIAFAVVGALIIAFAFFFAYRPGVKSRAAVGLIAVGALSLIVGGVAAGLDGQRDIHEHETTDGLQEEGEDICSSPDEFEADHDASQKVGATANNAATITLGEDGQLTFTVVGPVEPGEAGLTLPRSNPSNVLFVNASDHERRLSVDFGTQVVETEDGEEAEVAHLECTTLVDEGGEQNMTLVIPLPSSTAEDGFFFFVPGVESARLELIVP
jgi:hypothetical protein